MIVFIATGLLVGGLLGGRFTVGALIPAAALVVTVAALTWALTWAVQAAAPHWSGSNILALVVFLQIGYVCGAVFRLFVLPLRLMRQGKALGGRP